ncbi:uncharacterized protein EDB93DRAFT_327863 [Suillus bovinus]|uniref:uncharacterized protein n=1 Tax=Suillus bovinus TaxID=48563 RepID=UPI001B8654EC|nr:uncharacterized protein EDB93DRAFT_327863 [Suillus bovinus]KAG2150654.1 hypothetical protein EDB93DRAFT_327863 [Suillus bovinus]
MFLVIARWKSRPSLATNVVKRVTSYVFREYWSIFLLIGFSLAIAPTVVQAAAAMVEDSPARSATAAASLATLLAHVLKLQEAIPATEVEAIILLLVVEARRLGLSLLCPSHIALIRHTQLYLWWCRSSVARLRSRL